MCGDMLCATRMRTGLAAMVQQFLLANLTRPARLEATARFLHMTPRTLRRKLRQENTSFRELVDELRMDAAVMYLRNTELTMEQIAHAVGFSDSAKFRRAFRRWTRSTPLQVRMMSRGAIEPFSN